MTEYVDPLSNERLLELAEKYPPPDEWWDSDDDPTTPVETDRLVVPGSEEVEGG